MTLAGSRAFSVTLLQLATRIKRDQVQDLLQTWQPITELLNRLITAKKTGYYTSHAYKIILLPMTLRWTRQPSIGPSCSVFAACRPTLLSRASLHPVSLRKFPLIDVVKLVQGHHNPEPSATVQRFKFHSRCRQLGETVSTYVAELRCIAEHCKFNNLESMLCDRLVCGIQDPRIQWRLLAEAKLEFKQAFELAQAMECADHDAKTLINNSSTPVHTIPGQTPRQ